MGVFFLNTLYILYVITYVRAYIRNYIYVCNYIRRLATSGLTADVYTPVFSLISCLQVAYTYRYVRKSALKRESAWHSVLSNEICLQPTQHVTTHYYEYILVQFC